MSDSRLRAHAADLEPDPPSFSPQCHYHGKLIRTLYSFPPFLTVPRSLSSRATSTTARRPCSTRFVRRRWLQERPVVSHSASERSLLPYPRPIRPRCSPSLSASSTRLGMPPSPGCAHEALRSPTLSSSSLQPMTESVRRPRKSSVWSSRARMYSSSSPSTSATRGTRTLSVSSLSCHLFLSCPLGADEGPR